MTSGCQLRSNPRKFNSCVLKLSVDVHISPIFSKVQYCHTMEFPASQCSIMRMFARLELELGCGLWARAHFEPWLCQELMNISNGHKQGK